MANWQKHQSQQQVFYYKDFHVNKSQSLGNGSYGAVYKAKCDQLPCAAKILHQTIIDPADPGVSKIMQRFKQECTFLQNVRHPHIVQYLGVTVEPESRLPVLLMELLDENLTKMLQRSLESLAYYIQIDICHDIALAVAYLHSNDIIHRDLSSNNVLMIAGRRAKVTDFGMSKLVTSAPGPSMTPQTTCPGTPVYMPPEALRDPPKYTKKLDCFSEGVIMIQVCTRLWPDPGPRTQIVQDLRSPTGTIEMPVLEPERRRSHIDLIHPPTHPLVPIAVDCLSYQENDRPSSEELCQRLADLKESSKYAESAQQIEKVQDNFEATTIKLKEQIRDLQIREADYVQQIQEQHHEIQVKDTQLQKKSRQLDQKEAQLQKEIASQQKRIQQLSRKLEEQEKAATKHEQSNRSLQRQVEMLQDLVHQQRPQQSEVPPQPPPRMRPSSQLMEASFEEEHVYTSLIKLPLPPSPPVKTPPHPKPRPKPPAKQNSKPALALEWRDGGKAPEVMERGDTVVSGNYVYFMSVHGEVCSYDMVTKTWNVIPECPYCYSSLAVIHGFITAIGGCVSDRLSPENKLLCLMREKEWVKYFPPMPTKRWKSSAVTTKHHLVVAGGKLESPTQLNTVEVMDIQTLVWSTVASLPHPYSEASATICGDRLYLLGGFDDNGKTKSVLTCSLKELVYGSKMSGVWNRVADVPTTRSTCATINGHLLSAGGLDEQSRKTSAVYLYNPSVNSWELISNMPTAQYDRLMAVLPNNEIMVVGGCTTFKVNKVDVARIK